MKLDLRDPRSIAAWVRVHPERHLAHLRALWRIFPAFRETIEEGAKLAQQQAAQEAPT